MSRVAEVVAEVLAKHSDEFGACGTVCPLETRCLKDYAEAVATWHTWHVAGWLRGDA